MQYEEGDLVWVKIRLKSGEWTFVVGQVCPREEESNRPADEGLVVATLAGVRSVPALDVMPWRGS